MRLRAFAREAPAEGLRLMLRAVAVDGDTEAFFGERLDDRLADAPRAARDECRPRWP